MIRSWTRVVSSAAVLVVAGVVVYGQQPQPQAGGRGGGRGGRGGAGAPAAPEVPQLPQVSRTPKVDPALSASGKALWTTHCITCHGTNARGTETGPNLIRTETVNYDRATPTEPGTGQVLGPFLKKGHPTQSGKASASFTDVEIRQLAQFLSERVNETMRGSPTYIVLNENVITGDPKAGEAFFKGAGGCTKCHNDKERSLAGIGSRITNAQQLQARVLYPAPAGVGGGGRGRGAAPPPPPDAKPNPLAPVTTVTVAGGKPMTVQVIEEDSFMITFRDPSGATQTIRKGPTVKITVTNPMQWHLDFADRLEDKQMHDLTAYLWSLK
jgi:mono/diheme cytochrome c family protein